MIKLNVTTLQQSSKSISCLEAMEYDPIKNSFRCKQVCKKEKSCRKHRCYRKYCNLKNHQCQLVCGGILNCGLHKCQELCHATFCRDCRLFDQEIKCHCGQTAIKPKSQCLKTLRMCFFLCKRAHECGHAVNHWCHNDGECPPCTHTVFKMCVGEHRSFYVSCYVKTVCCNRPCGKFLQCGVHPVRFLFYFQSSENLNQLTTEKKDNK